MKESYLKVPVDMFNSMLILIQKARHSEYTYSDIQSLLQNASKLSIISDDESTDSSADKS